MLQQQSNTHMSNGFVKKYWFSHLNTLHNEVIGLDLVLFWWHFNIIGHYTNILEEMWFSSPPETSAEPIYNIINLDYILIYLIIKYYLYLIFK